MKSKTLYGLNKHLIEMIKLLESNKLPKVIMLSGKKGQGKFTLTHHFLSYIIDKTNYDSKNSIIKDTNNLFDNIKENYNPSVIYYNCENKKVKIEDIRNLRVNLQKSSLNNSKRFIIFDDVEHLNVNCINALLKTIEEPTEINYFILINNKKQKILDTLKSRAIEISIFLNEKERLKVTKKILSDKSIEQRINFENITLTPGDYLKYNQIILDNEINLEDNLTYNLDKLLKLNKVKKNTDYFNFAIHLINFYFYNEFKKYPLSNDLNDKRVNIIKKVHESNKLNLNHTNLINEIENYI